MGPHQQITISVAPQITSGLHTGMVWYGIKLSVSKLDYSSGTVVNPGVRVNGLCDLLLLQQLMLVICQVWSGEFIFQQGSASPYTG